MNTAIHSWRTGRQTSQFSLSSKRVCKTVLVLRMCCCTGHILTYRLCIQSVHKLHFLPIPAPKLSLRSFILPKAWSSKKNVMQMCFDTESHQPWHICTSANLLGHCPANLPFRWFADIALPAQSLSENNFRTEYLFTPGFAISTNISWKHSVSRRFFLHRDPLVNECCYRQIGPLTLLHCIQKSDLIAVFRKCYKLTIIVWSQINKLVRSQWQPHSVALSSSSLFSAFWKPFWLPGYSVFVVWNRSPNRPRPPNGVISNIS